MSAMGGALPQHSQHEVDGLGMPYPPHQGVPYRVSGACQWTQLLCELSRSNCLPSSITQLKCSSPWPIVRKASTSSHLVRSLAWKCMVAVRLSTHPWTRDSEAKSFP